MVIERENIGAGETDSKLRVDCRNSCRHRCLVTNIRFFSDMKRYHRSQGLSRKEDGSTRCGEGGRFYTFPETVIGMTFLVGDCCFVIVLRSQAW